MKNLPLIVKKDEPRIDSRVVAQQLGVEHESVMRLLNKYQADFEVHGLFRFEIGKPLNGRPEKFSYLNEDQCWLLLTYNRNTKKVRALKGQLVRALERHAWPQSSKLSICQPTGICTIN